MKKKSEQKQAADKQYSEALEAWAALRERLVASGYYASTKDADRYFVKHVEPAWQRVLETGDDTYLIDDLALTPTQRRLIHFFGRAHAGVGCTTRTPRVTCWPPFKDREGVVRTFRAISKRDLAKILGCSASAVEEAVDRFRGKGRAGDVFYGPKLAVTIAVETGIAIDGIFSQQTRFTFMLEDYEHGDSAAHSARVANGETWERQRKYCKEARIAQLQLRLVVPVDDAQDVAVSQ